MIAMRLIDWLMSINDMYVYRSNHREKRDSVEREREVGKKPHHIHILFWLFAKGEEKFLLFFRLFQNYI